MTENILHLPRYVKQLIVLLCDISLILIATWVSYFLRLEQFVILEGAVLTCAIYAILFSLPIFWIIGLYRSILRYSSLENLLSIFLGHVIFGLIFFSIFAIYKVDGVPRSMGILVPTIMFIFITGSRLTIKLIIEKFFLNIKSNLKAENTLIYGAGSGGRQVHTILTFNKKYNVVGFIDDNKDLNKKLLEGKNIYSFSDIEKIIQLKKIQNIIIAIPSISRTQRNKIIDKISKFKINIQTLPSFKDLADGKLKVSDILDYDIEDILERDSIKPNLELLKKNINSKTVIITGAGGSIGSEISRQSIKLHPKKLILLERNEYSLYKIQNEIEDIKNKLKVKNDTKVIPIISSIRSEARIEEIFKTFKPETVFHTAAYKHVNLVEENVIPGIENNVFGALNVFKLSVKYNCLNFVFVSSDKAVRPTNVMGATKRLAEISLKSYYKKFFNNKTKLTIVRFGNVLGSSGSIIPKFKKQIENGGPVTLTHEDVTRYFMTISEAAELVIQASCMPSVDGDVYVLDMGKQVKIKDLIKKMIKLSGLTLQENDNEGDINIKITGLRPGEKLYEELFLGNNPEKTSHPKIIKCTESFSEWDSLEPALNYLNSLIKDHQVKELLISLKKLVEEYTPSTNINDLLFFHKMMQDSVSTKINKKNDLSPSKLEKIIKFKHN